MICILVVLQGRYLQVELNYYLEEVILLKSVEFDILAWWKYLKLQKVARDILVVPMSTIASKYAFSISGRHVTPHCNRLHSDTLEALIYAQAWL